MGSPWTSQRSLPLYPGHWSISSVQNTQHAAEKHCATTSRRCPTLVVPPTCASVHGGGAGQFTPSDWAWIATIKPYLNTTLSFLNTQYQINRANAPFLNYQSKPLRHKNDRETRFSKNPRKSFTLVQNQTRHPRNTGGFLLALHLILLLL